MCDKQWRNISCEDVQQVISLPSEIPDRGFCENINQYMNLKLEQHEKLIQNMHNELEALSLSKEKEIDLFAAVVEDELKMVQTELGEINSMQINSLEQFNTEYEKNKQRQSKIYKIIDELYTDLTSVEKHSAGETKKVLSKCKDEANKLRHLSVQDIEDYFDAEITNLNVNTIKNFQKYEDIKLKFYVKGQEIIDDYHNILKKNAKYVANKHAENLWEMIKLKQNRDSYVKAAFNYSQQLMNAQGDFSEKTNQLVRKLSTFSEWLELPQEYEMNKELWDSWMDRFSSRIEELDVMRKSLQGILKTLIATVVESFDDKINSKAKLSSSLMSLSSQKPNADLQKLSSELVILKQSQNEDLRTIQGTWQDIIETLNSKIELSKSFFLDVMSIWKNHVMRVKKAQDNLETEFESINALCIRKEKEEMLKIKKQVKVAREAKDISKLNTCQAMIMDMYNQLIEHWEESYETQLIVVENTRTKDVDDIIAKKRLEINNILSVKYKKEWFHSPYPTSNSENLDVARFNVYLKAIDNKTLGMFELLERYVISCQDMIREEAQEWLDHLMQEIVCKYEKQFEDIRDMKNNTMEDTINVRSAEILSHNERLLSHSHAVKAALAQVDQQCEDVKLKQQLSLDNFSNKLKNLTEKPSESSRQIKNTIDELQREWKSLVESLQKNILDAKAKCTYTFNTLKCSNDLFSKTSKSFKNGGNYCPEELKRLNKELQELEKACKNKRQMLLSSYDNLAKDISPKILEATIERSHDKLVNVSLQEKIIDTLIILRVRLRMEVNHMKYKVEKFASSITHVGSLKFINDTLVFADVLNTAKIIHSHLRLPPGVLSLECTENKQKSVVSLKTSTKTEKSEKYKSTSITNQLFHYVTAELHTHEKNFFSNTKGLLLKKYASLLQDICEKLKTSSEVLRGSKSVKENQPKINSRNNAITELVEQVKFTLQSYNLECEWAWLCEATEFTNQLMRLREITNTLIGQELSSSHLTYINELLSLKTDYKAKLQGFLEESTAERDKTRNALKYSEAHPAHQDKLIALYEQAKDLSLSQRNHYRDLVMVYRVSLQSKHDKYAEQLKMLLDSLGGIQESVFNEEISNLLTKDGTEFGHVVFEKLTPEPAGAAPEQHPYPLSIWSDVDDLYNFCQNPSLNQLSNGTSCNKVNIIDFKRMAGLSAKESAEGVQKYYDEAVIYFKQFEEMVDAWLKSFKYDMNQAKEAHGFYS